MQCCRSASNTEGAVLAAKNLDWRRSSRTWDGNCVELSHATCHLYIRDSKDPGKILDISRTSDREIMNYVRQVAKLG